MDNYSNDPYWSLSFKGLELADETVKVVEERRVVVAGRQKRCPESSQRICDVNTSSAVVTQNSCR